MRIYNIANLSAPTIAGYFAIPDSVIENMEISGNRAVITTYTTKGSWDGRRQVHVLDISTPAAPLRLFTWGNLPFSIASYKFINNRLYLAAYNAGLQVYDLKEDAVHVNKKILHQQSAPIIAIEKTRIVSCAIPKSGPVSIAVFNYQGQLVWSKTKVEVRESIARFHLPGWLTGTYVVRITSGESAYLSRLILVAR
jgi:hypothetical protein